MKQIERSAIKQLISASTIATLTFSLSVFNLTAITWTVSTSAPACAAPATAARSAATANKAAAGARSNKSHKNSKNNKNNKSSMRGGRHHHVVAHDQNHINATVPVAPAIQTDPKVLEVLKYGARKHAEGNYDEAEAAFRHVLSRAPNTVDAFYNLGALAERKGDLIGALSDYRAALALKPNDKQLADAVQSVEKSLKARSSNFNENARQAVSTPGPFSGALPGGGQYNSQAFRAPGAAIDANMPVLGVSDGSMPTQDLPPVLPVDGGAFQLSSNKNGAVPPVLGVSPTSSSYAAPAVQQAPAQPPVIGAAPRSHPVARQVLNRALNTGTSMGLRAVGLHCPACQLFRFRF